MTATPKTWPQALRVAKRLLDHELQLWREAALAAQPHGKAKKLIENLNLKLAPDEARILQTIADAGPRYQQLLRLFGDSPDKRLSLSSASPRESAFQEQISNVSL